MSNQVTLPGYILANQVYELSSYATLIAAAATELDSRVNSVASNIITIEAQTYLNSLSEATAYITNAYSYISSFDYLYAAALTNLESRIVQLETYHNN